MARSDPGSRSRPARWSRRTGGRVLLVVAALVASVGVAGAQPAAAAERWLQVDAGGRYTCGIRESSAGAGMGTLWCWGLNDNGQLGLGDTTSRSVPTQVGRDADWVMVTAGEMHTCALKGAARARFCWGNNFSGRLGLGTDGAKDSRYARYLSPVAGGDRGWRTLSAGEDSTCGIVDVSSLLPRRLLCWGDNQYGQVGVGSLVNRTIPSPVASGGQWVDVSVGEWFACGVREGGQVPRERYCWGRSPALGLGQLSRSESKVTVPTTISDGSWSTVTTGAYHACGISVNRRAYCWGSLLDGALGLGEFDPYDKCCDAPETRLPGTSWAQIQAGGDSTCGLTTNGTRLCWGRNNVGQLGLGDYQKRWSPAEPTAEGPVWASITLGDRHACGIQKSGALFCWGDAGHGRLGTPRIPVGHAGFATPIRIG